MSEKSGENDTPGTDLQPVRFKLDVESESGQSENLVVTHNSALKEQLGETEFLNYRLKNGGYVSITKIIPAEKMTLKVDSLTGDHLSSTLMTLKGQASLQFPDTDEHFVTQTQGLNFRYFGKPATFTLEAEKEVRSFGVNLPPDVLERYLDYKVPDALKLLVDPSETVTRFAAYPVSAQMFQAVSLSIAPGLVGSLRNLQMESAALLYFSMVAHAIEGNNASAVLKVTEKDRKAARKAYEILTNSLREPPALSELSADVGITEKRLNAAFRELYSGTVFEILRLKRLEEARNRFEEGETNIKQVSWEVGYSHVSNFTAAFKSMFNIAPAAYIRNYTP